MSRKLTTLLPLPNAAWITAAFLGVAIWLPHGTAQAQVADSISIVQETLNSDFFGADARTMSMGNTGVSHTRDGSALVYNPANLARVKRLEFRGSLAHLRSEGASDIEVGGVHFTQDHRISKSRINGLSLTVPVPTYRGSLVFGFGVHRANNFDRSMGRHYRMEFLEGALADSGRVTETGGLWKWTAAGAMDISPRISAGLSLHLLTGKDEYRWRGAYSETTSDGGTSYAYEFYDEQSIDIDYLGVAATAGLTYVASEHVTAGLTIETPTYLAADESSLWQWVEIYDTSSSDFYWEYADEDIAAPSYNITRPLVFSLGVTTEFDRLLVAGDLRYSDWTQLEFEYDEPKSLEQISDEIQTEEFIRDGLTDVLSLHIGGEYLFPEQGLRLRAGYFRDPLPVDDKYIEKQRQYFTAGVGFLIDRVMTLDLAYVHGGYELRNDDPGTYNTEYKTRRVFATFGYRI